MPRAPPPRAAKPSTDFPRPPEGDDEGDLPDLPDEDEGEEGAEERGGARRTRNPALQAKLDLLARLGAEGKVREFCQHFLPLDLSAEEAEEFTTDLEADAVRWEQISGELAVLASGEGVRRIIGDQVRGGGRAAAVVRRKGGKKRTDALRAVLCRPPGLSSGTGWWTRRILGGRWCSSATEETGGRRDREQEGGLLRMWTTCCQRSAASWPSLCAAAAAARARKM